MIYTKQTEYAGETITQTVDTTDELKWMLVTEVLEEERKERVSPSQIETWVEVHLEWAQRILGKPRPELLLLESLGFVTK